jgi:type I restriction enzyme, R subunit
MPSDVSEKGLETIIEHSLVDESGYVPGDQRDYEREYALDTAKLAAFVLATQPDAYAALSLGADSPRRTKFLQRLQGEIEKRGVIDVLRKGIRDDAVDLSLYCSLPSAGNAESAKLFRANIFSVTRQLRYSLDETRLALDMAIFVNGLPLATLELKNSLTKQGCADAVEQYKRDREPRELLFHQGRCMAHFAVDDRDVYMCAQLRGKDSWFLPFNRGYKSGAGNPPNPQGLATDYLWKAVFKKESLADIIENFAQLVEKKDEKSGKKKREQIFPRYHQLEVVHALLAASAKDGVGARYLVQHSAGSGKSNSISWLAQQLIGLERGGAALFDSIIVVTDRRILDRQIRENIKQFAQVGSVVGAVTEGSAQLKSYIEQGKKIIITTIQKFPIVLEQIGDGHRDRKFAIIIDEAHSSQGGRVASKMNMVLAEAEPSYGSYESEDEIEDRINEIISSRKMLGNASYYAFTATPKNRTLEIFGIPFEEGGQAKHRPFHCYSMKQAIEEGFILDVLQGYTPVYSYYRLIKAIEGDPEFDTKKAQKKLRRYVESHDYAIRQKAEIMIDHFEEEVIGRRKIGGLARAMVVTSGIERAIQYYHAFKDYLGETKSRYKAIVAFSGEHEYKGVKLTESSLNGFPSNDIPDRFEEDPYRFLIVADKFQTGYDQPLLHTMYVDKQLAGIKAVQTLSRLNRAHPLKSDTFVLDFMNDSESIWFAFADYYRSTILSSETDPNKLHDLEAELAAAQVYSELDIAEIVGRFLRDEGRERLDPILDACAATYSRELDEEAQVSFKGGAKAFVRTYNFLASILSFGNPSWEKLCIFLTLLVPKLPAPREEDLSRGILESIDMESYRVQVQALKPLILPDEDAEIDPAIVGGPGGRPDPEIDRLSNILKEFNDQFGNIEWKDGDKVRRIIAEEIPAKVASDKSYQNAMARDDRQNARIEHDRALERVIVEMLSDQTELFKQFMDNQSFRKWLSERIFDETYKTSA